MSSLPHEAHWKPPVTRVLKLNLEGGRVGEAGWGWGFIIRDHPGDVVLVGVKQGSHFAGAIIEEACACLFGVRIAHDCGHLDLIVEGDCLPLINKLSIRVPEETTLGLLFVIF